VSVITGPPTWPPGAATLVTVSGPETTLPEHRPEQTPRTLVPLDPPMVPFVLGGIAAWLVALCVTLAFRDTHESWFWICVAGLLWGIPGLITMLRHDARRRRRRAGPQP
jgi:hypothetical protein